MNKKFTAILISIFFPLLFLSAQDGAGTDDGRSYERTSKDVESFVNDVVSHVETGLDKLFQQHTEDYDQDEDDNFTVARSSDAVTFNGDTEIGVNDTIQGDLIIKYGTLTVRGVIGGDVLVVNGTIVVKSTGHIKGNARSMNGTIIKEEGGIVDGYTEQSTDSKTYRRKRTQRVKYSYSFKPYQWVDAPFVSDNFLFRYNRTEGWFFGLGSEKKFYWDGSKIISGYGSFGYGFAMHRWRLQFGLDRQFATDGYSIYETGAEVHSVTDTKDEWLMKLSENNIASIFLHEDFRDYFQREGFSVHTARYSKDGDESSMIDLRFLNDQYTSMFNNTNWSLFRRSRNFRANPLIDEGTIRSVLLTAGVSTAEHYRNRSEGWDLYGRAEYAGKQLGGDYDFNQVVVDARRFQQLSDDDQISLRLRAGSLEGTPVVQRSFELGGANTMPAYGFKEFSGNRMVLGNLEYLLQGDLIDEMFFWPGRLDLILFTDAGATANVATSKSLYDGFDSITGSAVKSDIGFGFAWSEAGTRLGFAWRTDKKAPVAIFLRLNRAF